MRRSPNKRRDQSTHRLAFIGTERLTGFGRHIADVGAMTPMQIALADPRNDVRLPEPCKVLVKDGEVTEEGRRRGIKL